MRRVPTAKTGFSLFRRSGAEPANNVVISEPRDVYRLTQGGTFCADERSVPRGGCRGNGEMYTDVTAVHGCCRVNGEMYTGT